MAPIGALRFTIASVLSALLFGCESVGPNHQVPSSETATAYKGLSRSDGRHLDPQWYRLFEDRALNALVVDLERESLDLKAAYARRGQAYASLGIDRSALFPQVAADAGVERNRSSESDVGAGSFSNYYTRYRVGASLGYEIDLWGRVRRLVEAGQAEVGAAEMSLEDVRLSLQTQLARSYFALRFIDTEEVVLSRALATRKQMLALARDRFEGGRTSELDVARAEAELAATKTQLVALQAPRSQLENAIAVLAGKHPSNYSIRSSAYRREAPDVPVGVPADLLGRRPDVAAAERQLAASSARIGVATAAFFPQVSLTGSGALSTINSSDFLKWSSRAFSIGPQITLPVFQGGRLKGGLALAKAQHEEALAVYQKTVLNAFADVENALASRRAAANEVAAQRQSVIAASKTFELSNLRYKEGVSSYLDVVDSQRELLTAQRSEVQARGHLFEATVQLIQALGGGFAN